MADRDELDYSYYYVKNYLKGRPIQTEYRLADEVPSERVKHIPRVTALPDEIDDEPFAEKRYAEAGRTAEPERPYGNYGSYISADYEDFSKRHVVELTGGESEPAPKKNKKRGKRGKRDNNPYRKRGIALVVLTIVICAVVTLLIADSVNDGYILDEIKSVFTGSADETYYAVETGSYADRDTARVFSLEISALGGSGYVLNDNGVYRVLAEVYPDKNNADIVVSRLLTGGYDAKVYTITMPKLKYEAFPQSMRNITKKVIGYADECYRVLYDVSCGLAAKKIDKTGAENELKTLLMAMRNKLIEYESNADNKKDDEAVMKLRAQLTSVAAALENLMNTSTSAELLSNSRYTSALILNTHRALLNSYSDA